jgi:hypothetical protein
MIKVGGACMEIVTNQFDGPAGQATIVCHQKGRRLCTPGEFRLGCNLLPTMLTGIGQEYEWVDSAIANDPTGSPGTNIDNVRFLAMGGGSCFRARQTEANSKYRCCL